MLDSEKAADKADLQTFKVPYYIIQKLAPHHSDITINSFRPNIGLDKEACSGEKQS